MAVHSLLLDNLENREVRNTHFYLIISKTVRFVAKIMYEMQRCCNILHVNKYLARQTANVCWSSCEVPAIFVEF